MSKKTLSLDVISRITSRINSSEDINTLLHVIMETTKDILDTEGCSLLLYDKESDSLFFKVTKGEKGDSLSELRVPRGKGIAGTTLDTLQPIIVNDAENDSRIYRNIDEKSGFITKNLVCVPMIAQGEIQGVLEAVNTIGRPEFDHHDIKLLAYLSDLAAIAIRNRLLIDELLSRVNELDCLYQISQSLFSISDMEIFLDQAVKTIADVINVFRVSLVFRDPETKKYRVSKSAGFSLDVESAKITESSSIIMKVLESGEPLLVENIETSGLDSRNPSRYQTKSFLSVPVKNGDMILGVLSVADKKNKSIFDTMDMRVLSTISSQIAEAYNAIEARLQTEKLTALNRDMKLAAEIQKYSLPQIPKKINNLEIETYYKASKQIGGDFYDLLYHNEDEISVSIADVSGKGISAALFMEYSKTIVAGEASRTTSTSHALEESHKIIKDRSGFFMFVTLMLVRINMKGKTLKYSSAGHNRMILYRSLTRKVELLSGKGGPLGVSNTEFSEHLLEYFPDDILVLYTDGITETVNNDEEFYSEERLIALIENNGDKSAEDLKNLIIQNTENFRGTKEQNDDFTLYIIKLK